MISRMAALKIVVKGPKICATSTSDITLRKNSTIENFLNLSVLENTQVTRNRQSVFEKWGGWASMGGDYENISPC